jgi:RimJ/RimL family protein N-acetyltransferase
MNDDQNFVDFKCPYCRDVVTFVMGGMSRLQECPNCAESLVVPTEEQEFANPIPVPIKTPRLLLRRLQTSDYKDLLEFMGDEEIYAYMRGTPQDEPGVLRWLERDQFAKLTSKDAAYNLGIQQQEGGKVIGDINLWLTGEERMQANLQVHVNRKFQRQGLGTEALKELLEFCFDGLHLHRVMAACDSRNVAAVRICEKAGMRKEGEFVQDTWLDGEWRNTVWYALLKEQNPRKGSSPA